MITNYGSTSGIRSGAWSVETGLDLQTFGHANIMKAINIDGQVYIATNDFTEHTGAIWLLGQDEPVYLRDIITDFENPYFTPGGLFALPNGEGLGILGTGKVDGVETHFMAQIKFVDKVFEYLVDIDLNGEANDMGIPHDGMTSDPGLVGDLPLGGEVHMQIGDTAQIVSGFRDGEGRFILPKEELFELFPEVENGGDFEAKIWTGVENVAEYLKTKLQFACIVSPPTEFEILGIDDDGRLTWEPSRGASRYDVGYRLTEVGEPIWIVRDVRDTNALVSESFLDALEDAIELVVVARDAAGNQTEATHAVMSA
ncbi:MAG: hypothetical protein EA381_18455 [Planctomycetaceae bacterium]|nr:MAG: hypothetical protein EA381_18455 [Planctomycetaceae bacterium]